MRKLCCSLCLENCSCIFLCFDFNVNKNMEKLVLKFFLFNLGGLQYLKIATVTCFHLASLPSINL